ncbi:MAG: hypothetical protein JW703_02410 [Candidatus Diapherotrites archaeon]|nr:hypothetical protein [Candidatus Diapherotrites archaeon]
MDANFEYMLDFKKESELSFVFSSHHTLKPVFRITFTKNKNGLLVLEEYGFEKSMPNSERIKFGKSIPQQLHKMYEDILINTGKKNIREVIVSDPKNFLRRTTGEKKLMTLFDLENNISKRFIVDNVTPMKNAYATKKELLERLESEINILIKTRKSSEEIAKLVNSKNEGLNLTINEVEKRKEKIGLTDSVKPKEPFWKRFLGHKK